MRKGKKESWTKATPSRSAESMKPSKRDESENIPSAILGLRLVAILNHTNVATTRVLVGF